MEKHFGLILNKLLLDIIRSYMLHVHVAIKIQFNLFELLVFPKYILFGELKIIFFKLDGGCWSSLQLD